MNIQLNCLLPFSSILDLLRSSQLFTLHFIFSKKNISIITIAHSTPEDFVLFVNQILGACLATLKMERVFLTNINQEPVYGD